ncbi:CLIP domain-containing serine protease B9-like [Palaemon carinicauda]|uniref:CLIP domain-containing serine protease B9-like n=1 Tax=Palaemon carinicauda TaxID=392227 RepID=UPI0035B63A77
MKLLLLVSLLGVLSLFFTSSAASKSSACGWRGVCRPALTKCKQTAFGRCTSGYKCCKIDKDLSRGKAPTTRRQCRTKRKCSSEGGLCKNPLSDPCMGLPVESLCKGASCSCCIEGGGRSTCPSKPSCRLKGGICVDSENSEWCSNAIVYKGGCKGKQCVCCLPKENKCLCGTAYIPVTTVIVPVPTTPHAATTKDMNVILVPQFPHFPIKPKPQPGKPKPQPGKPKALRASTHTNKFPWLAGIKKRPSNSYNCTGSIINTLFVITSASCVNGLRPKDIQLGVGDFNQRSREDAVPGLTRTARVKSVFVHEQFSDTTLENNIALLLLRKPLDLISYNEVKPVCLPTTDDDDYSGDAGVLAGWGVSTDSSTSNGFRELDVSILDQDCNGATSVGGAAVNSQTVCTSGRGVGSRIAGTGDPLTVEKDGRHILVGVLSAVDTEQDIHTRTSKYIEWIMETIGSDGSFCG